MIRTCKHVYGNQAHYLIFFLIDSPNIDCCACLNRLIEAVLISTTMHVCRENMRNIVPPIKPHFSPFKVWFEGVVNAWTCKQIAISNTLKFRRDLNNILNNTHNMLMKVVSLGFH